MIRLALSVVCSMPSWLWDSLVHRVYGAERTEAGAQEMAQWRAMVEASTYTVGEESA